MHMRRVPCLYACNAQRGEKSLDVPHLAVCMYSGGTVLDGHSYAIPTLVAYW